MVLMLGLVVELVVACFKLAVECCDELLTLARYYVVCSLFTGSTLNRVCMCTL